VRVISNLKDFAVLAGLVGAGFAVVYVALRRSLRRAVSEHQQATERQVNELALALKSLEVKLAELSPAVTSRPLAAPGLDLQAAASLGETVSQEPQGIAPEILVVIAAAVTAYLGSNARVRSVSTMQPAIGAACAWSQQGRVFVQSSHNIRRGR
jgi:hypothetical protein